MVLDSLNVPALGFVIDTEQGKETGQRLMACANPPGYIRAALSHYQAAIFLVLQIPGFRELLHHARDRCLLDLERRSDVHHSCVAFLLDKLMDALEVILSALARCIPRRHA